MHLGISAYYDYFFIIYITCSVYLNYGLQKSWLNITNFIQIFLPFHFYNFSRLFSDIDQSDCAKLIHIKFDIKTQFELRQRWFPSEELASKESFVGSANAFDMIYIRRVTSPLTADAIRTLSKISFTNTKHNRVTYLNEINWKKMLIMGI